MSWNIYIYAEKFDSDTSTWKPLSEQCICDSFKYYDDYNCEFYHSIPEIATNEISCKSLKDINCSVRWCLLSDFKSHFTSKVDSFITQVKTLYSALGVSSSCIDDECCDDYFIPDEEQTYQDKCKCILNKMTFPVNKNLLYEMANSFREYSKSMEMIGLCNVISSMIDYNDKVRLLFIIM